MKQKAVRILLLDNIDSFTWNIHHYLEALGADVVVRDNQSIETEELAAFDAVVLSPGPGIPSEAGKLMTVIAAAVQRQLPLLGVCLGMQAIAEFYGGHIYNQSFVRHGQQVRIRHTETRLFTGIPVHFSVGLYHSWAVAPELPEPLTATAFSDDGIMMALEHRSERIFGVQFHPESILSEFGKEVLANFLAQVG